MPGSKIIEIILVDGDPAGIRVVTIANWAGVALTTYRSDMSRFLEREELERPALYFLAGKDVKTGKISMYVGESDSFKQRINGHAEKTFWDQAVVFTSNDGRFNKATVKYLEALFYEEISKAGRVVMMNSNRPRGVSLGESDTSIANEYKQNASILLGVLGFIDICMPMNTWEESTYGNIEAEKMLKETEITVDGLLINKVAESGWVIASSTKGDVRFLTSRLKDVIPCNATGNWKGREAFLFEIEIRSSRITFKTVIAPGDESTRSILKDALHSIDGAVEPRGDQWLMHFIFRLASIDENTTIDVIKARINERWSDVQDIVAKVENAIIEWWKH